MSPLLIRRQTGLFETVFSMNISLVSLVSIRRFLSPTQQRGFVQIGIGYAFLPGDGIYNMDVAGAAECAKVISAKHNVPIHLKPGKGYGLVEARRFAKLAPNALLIRPNETVDL